MWRKIKAEIEHIEQQLATKPQREITLRFEEPGLIETHSSVSIKPRFTRHKERTIYNVVSVKALNEDGQTVYVATLEKMQ